MVTIRIRQFYPHKYIVFKNIIINYIATYIIIQKYVIYQWVNFQRNRHCINAEKINEINTGSR